ncbi:hypothetical protein PR202_ga15277 [Eleusine coracana subsp. coracana]|uniref:Acid phosphatase/vanadium-dependent haloperoxidase-related protein n=1 Tax=Eleusine coracana subsp. coracana TaxID=191504 RepID=A0AAV5CJT5_ELECO|nr:hypothetical protein QOZ80_6BG0494910 [Eleusine coracana subsp. coracana]GJM98284.1 hypothetical protein PR202_ga15277 [Eleusine coracana subsp. coracana]
MAQPLLCSSSPSSSCSPRRPLPSTSASSLPLPSSWCPPRHAACRRAVVTASALHFGLGEIAELAQNKVLIAATAASAIGQLSKPFTSGKDGAGLDIRTVFRSGGMPSTHSAAVVAVATSLGLERGFADSVFGMSVVFAAIIMYDAQGVRREVGNHAKVLNKFLALEEKTDLNLDLDMTAELVSVREDVISSSHSSASPSRHSSGTEWWKLNASRSSEPDGTELAYIEKGNRLSENVGHTEIQVTAGALLGFVVSVVVYATL